MRRAPDVPSCGRMKIAKRPKSAAETPPAEDNTHRVTHQGQEAERERARRRSKNAIKGHAPELQSYDRRTSRLDSLDEGGNLPNAPRRELAVAVCLYASK